MEEKRKTLHVGSLLRGEIGGNNPKITTLKVAADRFRSSVCIYVKSTHEVRRLVPKLRKIFTNGLRNISASTITSAKRCLVKYTILQRIVFSVWRDLVFILFAAW